MTGEYQTERNGYVALKLQTAIRERATGTGARILPITGGGGKYSRGASGSGLVRRDGLSVRGRLDGQKTQGAYPSELVIGTVADELYAAIMRAEYAAGAAITQATAALSSATVSASGSTVTFSAGSVIAAGVRVGEVHRWSAGLAAGDLNQNLICVAVTATSITYHRALTAVTGPVASYSFGQPGRLLSNPANPIKRYFTIEEAELDIAGGELFGDAMFSKFGLKMATTGAVTTSFDWVGAGDFEPIDAGDGPWFTDPADYDGEPLSVVDCTVRLGSEVLVDLTGLDITFDIGATAEEVCGAKVSPNVADGALTINVNVTALRKNLAWVKAVHEETPLSLHFLAEGPESAGAKPFFYLHIPNFTVNEAAKSEFSKNGKTKINTLTVPRELVGIDTRGGAYRATMATIQISNAS
ncbi:MAG TPA: phage tail tube protein [Azospirillaceae bacterium]|nr:phage tail tube protein [Azospirillaceae bacterium]